MTITEQTFTFGRMAEAPEGPWTDEPDKVVWVDETTDLDCMILRNRWGAWCGYVGVPDGHPWYQVGYSGCAQRPPCGTDYCDHSPDSSVDVHGGLTFADRCHEGRGDDAICHTPAPGRPSHIWWLGFDCGHAGDFVPLSELSLRKIGFYSDGEHGPDPFVTGVKVDVDGGWMAMPGSYKTMRYAKAEVTALAVQAKAAAR